MGKGALRAPLQPPGKGAFPPRRKRRGTPAHSLEKEKFPWPRKFEEATVKIGPRELSWLLDGYEFWKMKPHEELRYARVS